MVGLNMKTGIIQIKVDPDPQKNIDQLLHYSQQTKEADIVVLPELWICPYDNGKIKESVRYQKQAMDALRTISARYHQILVGGTIVEKQGTHLYNTCFIYNDGQIIGSYRKTHLMEFHGRTTYQEKDVFSMGNQIVTFDTPWGKMGVVICYDIRFPELPRLLALQGIRVLFVPAAFNENVGKAHWNALMQTRAMENQIFVCAVNPAAYTYRSYTSYGRSLIADPFGRIQVQMKKNQRVHIEEIDLHKIDQIRQRMPFWNIRRNDLYK